MNHKKIYIVATVIIVSISSFFVPKIVGGKLLSSNTSSNSYGTTTCGLVKHGDITWTFSTAVKCGEFANGEPWVVGPVTVTSISPAPYIIPAHKDGSKDVPDWDMNGSMINPIPAQGQGFSQQIDVFYQVTDAIRYVKAKNVALRLPNLVLQPNDVLVSSKAGKYPSGRGTNFIESISALTVLTEVPDEGSFRPSIYGTDRTVRWNIDQINWNILKTLGKVPGTPTTSMIYESMPNLPWIEWSSHWVGGNMMPVDNTADGIFYNNPVGQNSSYGREIAYKFGAVGLWLNTNQNTDDKKAIAIRMIQNGIDIYEYLKYPGAGFYHDGGHKAGRKLPVVMAAAMLNDGNIKATASNPDLFQEDTQTWTVKNTDVGRTLGCYLYKDGIRTYCRQTYLITDVGMAEWGIRHRFEPNQDDKSWNANGEYDYRNTNYPAMIAPVLAADIMNLESLWNHPSLFAYAARHYGVTGAASLPFLNNMYIEHKLGGTTTENPTTTVPTPLAFAVGNRVTVSAASVNVRALPGLQGFLRGTQSQGASGIILDGSRQSDDITWWYVNYSTGASGWVGENTHTVTTANVSTPGAQYTLTSTGTNGTITGNLETYRKGVVSYLTAMPNTGYEFASWTGCTTSTGNICEVTMNSNKTVSAQFEKVIEAGNCSKFQKPTIQNTGADTTASMTIKGDTTISTDNTLLENTLINGKLTIDGADNVTIRNVVINGGGALYPLHIKNGATKVLVENVTVTNGQSTIVYIVGDSNATLRKLQLDYSTGDAMKIDGHHPDGVLVESSYIGPHLGSADGAHADGIQTQIGGTNITFRGNTIDMPVTIEELGAGWKSNSNFLIDKSTNYTIECNWLNGGNYTIFNSSSTNTKIINNKLGRDYRYGILSLYGTNITNCGNVWEDTGELFSSAKCTKNETVPNPGRVCKPWN